MQFNNKSSEPKALIRLLKFPEQTYNFSKRHNCHFPDVRIRLNAFHEEAITLQDDQKASKPELTICRSNNHALHSL